MIADSGKQPSIGRKAEAEARLARKAGKKALKPVEKAEPKTPPKGADVHRWKNDLRRMILIALDNAGGAKYLERQAQVNPVAFMGLLGKLLPAQLREANDGAGPQLIVQVDWAGPGRLSYGAPETLPAIEAPMVQDVTEKAPSGLLRPPVADAAIPASDIDDLL